jgi:hypothetical protein
VKRQELLLNLTLLIIIGALIYLIYESRDMPRGLDELDVQPVAAVDGATSGSKSRSGDGAEADSGADEDAMDNSGGDDADAEPADAEAPGSETTYGARNGKSANGKKGSGKAADAKAKDAKTTGGKEVASAGGNSDRAGEFGRRNIFRALLTPTPTPPPPTPTPAPTPNITTALGSWRLLSVYEGKAMMEDVKASEAGAEGAIWEMAEGATKQVDVGNGIMKTATLKKIDNANPYNPEVVFGLEDTKTERKINLDTEPVTGAPAPKK